MRPSSFACEEFVFDSPKQTRHAMIPRDEETEPKSQEYD